MRKGKISRGFDRLAPIYDKLAALVYGKEIIEAQACHLSKIPQGGRILILGGGTGIILKQLLDVNPTCRIVYQEISAEMIQRARQRCPPSFTTFRLVTDLEIPDEKYDAIITNFFLDMFNRTNIEFIGKAVGTRLKENGIWIVTDFINMKKWWQSFLLFVMYRFFRLTCGIEAIRLPEWSDILQEIGFRKKESIFFFGSFINSVLYKSALAEEQLLVDF